jgi:hypothetical protein
MTPFTIWLSFFIMAHSAITIISIKESIESMRLTFNKLSLRHI